MKSEFDGYEILSLRWMDIRNNAIIENEFDRDEFISLFQETFEEIKKYSISTTIDRNIMDLVFNVSGFVATRLVKISYEHSAATEMAEAMLHCCLYEEPHNEIISKGEWDIFGDVNIEFNQPEEMLMSIAYDIEKMDELIE